MTLTAGNKLRAFRRSLEWTAERLAKQVGCERSYVSLLEAGRRTPSLKVAASIERLTRHWGRGPIMASDWIAADTSEAA